MRLLSFLPMLLLMGALHAQNPCSIFDVTVETGDCNPGSLTYQLLLDFKVNNPGNDSFEVWAGNGQYLGLFPLSQLPLKIPAFPWDGDPIDHVKVCINDNPDCCATTEFVAPNCFTGPCDINDLTVETGDCTSDSTYRVTINFSLNAPTLADAFGVWANNTFLGFYFATDLPLVIDSFPWNGGAQDYLKICVFDVPSPNFPPLCCQTVEIQVPDCLPAVPCGIKAMAVETDTCSSDSTFGLWVKFLVNDSTAVDSFHLWANGDSVGTFGYDQVPLYIPDFPWNGLIYNTVRVCTGNAPSCCKEIQFLAPDCLPFGPCEVTDITIKTGACTSDSTFKALVNFQATNPGDGNFILWANGTLIDTFPLDTVPLAIDSFPWAGGDTNLVQICISGATPDTIPCCLEEKFKVPDCLFADSCAITNVVVDPLQCNDNNLTYSLFVNFDVSHPGNDFFELWAGNGVYLGLFKISDLPVTIPNFPCNNADISKLKICINDSPDCCTIVEFPTPNCCISTDPCEITNLAVQTGDCTSGESYEVWVNFQVSNPFSDHFGVWANGEFIGTFNLDSLPLYIPNFPWNGGQNDVIKVCLMSPDGMVGCCKIKEFAVPDCIEQPCEIFNLGVDTGDCTGDSTYSVTINFSVDNPPGDTFALWANGEFFGLFDLDDLPLTIDSFPWNGGNHDVVKVCMSNSNDPNAPSACCRTKEFAVPDCLEPGGPCEIYDLTVETGDCTGDSTYTATINFLVQDPPSNTFHLWTNGQFYGMFNLDELPLTINDFPWNGGQNDLVKVCFVSGGAVACCDTKEFLVPDCLGASGCEVFYLAVETGDCTGDSTYNATIVFMVNNAPSDTFGVWANGEFIGNYTMDQLPLTIEDFPWNGGANDVVKVCMSDPNHPDLNCCQTIEFDVPDCITSGGDCEIYCLAVDAGDCTSDSTYNLTVNFSVDNPPGDLFALWANGMLFDTFNLDDLPVTIDNFPWDGGPHDFVKVCLIDPDQPNAQPGCCEIVEFAVPDCLQPGGPCEIYDLTVETGDCTGDSTYTVTIDFEVHDAPGNTFSLWANGQFYGMFNLDELPLTINDFPWNGGQNDLVKVCFVSGGAVACCDTKEFQVPDCLGAGGCEVFYLAVETGDCTSDSTYNATINFMVNNAPSDTFGVWANGEFIGNYTLNQLPLTIEDFPWNGGANDYVKVCMVDPDHPDLNCCQTIEFEVPDCLIAGGDCEVFYLAADVGDCTSDSTYSVTINFMVNNAPTDIFGVWANGEFFDTFNLNDLPITIDNFPWNGGNHDFVKVCMIDPDHPDLHCCETIEFEVPDCLQPGGPCEIYDLTVETGDCTGDSTYTVTIDFQVDNPPGNTFGVWANGEFLGTFNLDSLPLTISDFPWNGGAHDVVKVCFSNNAGMVTCCRTKEFAVPDCIEQGVCQISDLVVLPTPCLCGQFFAIVTFKHENGGIGGFEIVGNGTNYGSFPYNTQQPIILGPLPGDGTTQYEFGVSDVQFPDCGDDVLLGSIDCMTPVVDPNSDSRLMLSPNPTANWLSVAAQLPGNAKVGEATVDIHHADGRLARSITVPDGSNFLLDVSELPSGVYRLTLLAAAGRLEGTFVKQQ